MHHLFIARDLHLNRLVGQHGRPRIAAIDDLQRKAACLDRIALCTKRRPQIFQERCNAAIKITIAVGLAART